MHRAALVRLPRPGTRPCMSPAHPWKGRRCSPAPLRRPARHPRRWKRRPPTCRAAQPPVAASPPPQQQALRPTCGPGPQTRADSRRTGRRPHRGTFHIQIGAYQSQAEAEKRLASARELAPGVLGNRAPVTTQVKQGDKLYFRARYAGFEAKAAASACTELQTPQDRLPRHESRVKVSGIRFQSPAPETCNLTPTSAARPWPR